MKRVQHRRFFFFKTFSTWRSISRSRRTTSTFVSNRTTKIRWIYRKSLEISLFVTFMLILILASKRPNIFTRKRNSSSQVCFLSSLINTWLNPLFHFLLRSFVSVWWGLFDRIKSPSSTLTFLCRINAIESELKQTQMTNGQMKKDVKQLKEVSLILNSCNWSFEVFLSFSFFNL